MVPKHAKLAKFTEFEFTEQWHGIEMLSLFGWDLNHRFKTYKFKYIGA